jgi:prophage regulatory protein
MTEFSHPEEARFLRLPGVLARYGCSRASVYAWMSRGDFPEPVKLGRRLVAWRRHDLEAWESRRSGEPSSRRLPARGGLDLSVR